METTFKKIRHEQYEVCVAGATVGRVHKEHLGRFGSSWVVVLADGRKAKSGSRQDAYRRAVGA